MTCGRVRRLPPRPFLAGLGPPQEFGRKLEKTRFSIPNRALGAFTPEPAISWPEFDTESGLGVRTLGGMQIGTIFFGANSAIRVRSERWMGVALAGQILWLPIAFACTQVGTRSSFSSVTLQGIDPRLAPTQPRVLDGRPLLGGLLHRIHPAAAGQPEILSLLVRELEQAAAIPSCISLPRDPRLTSVCELVESLLHRRTDMAWCAAHCGLSPRSLQRLFVAECGMGPGDWIRKRRALEALWLLEGGMPLAEAASTCGYSSASAFGAMFRKSMGAAPRRFSRAASR